MSILPKSDTYRGDDETAEGTVVPVGGRAEKLGIGTSDMAARLPTVSGIAVLPISQAFRIGHLGLALRNRFGERTDGSFAPFGKGTCVRMNDGICLRATVAGTHNNAFRGREFATKMIKREGGLYFSHIMYLFD